MRVLFINSREDAQQNPGGDTIQLIKTKAALEALGVMVDIRQPHEIASLPSYDLSHIFNIQEPRSTWEVFNALRRTGKPIVLSPIYWGMFAYWFETAVTQHKRWRWPARYLNVNRLNTIYENWQQLKAPVKSLWRIQRRLLTQCDRVLPNSNNEAEFLQTEFLLTNRFRQKVDVVPNGIDSSLYRTLPKPNYQFLQKYGLNEFVLEVGTINPVKNQLGLIEALFSCSVPIVFIGQIPKEFSDYGEACKVRAAERGNVIFIKQISHEELPGVYALATVHALPSWRETPGLVSLEAAAAGCQIVSTSIGSTREYFGDMAWYCYPNDLESIEKAVKAALQAQHSTDLRKHILSAFTWNRAGEVTLDAYERVLN